MVPGEPYYEVIRAWIADGASLKLDTPKVAKIELSPSNPVVQQIGLKQQIRVLATYVDGEVRDVTREAFVESRQHRGRFGQQARGSSPRSDAGRPRSSPASRGPTPRRPSPSWGTARASPGSSPRPSAGSTSWSSTSGKRLKIKPSGLCTDAEFLRRVYLDLTGLPPRPTTSGPSSPTSASPVKRDELVDRADRRQGICRILDEQVGRPAPGQPQIPGCRGGGRLPQVDSRPGRQEPPLRPVRPVDPHGRRDQPRAPGGVVLQDPPRPGLDDGEHDAAVPRGAVQLQQVPRPPVRALDPGPVLSDGRLLLPGRPQDRPRLEGRQDHRRERRRGPDAPFEEVWEQARRRGHPRPDQEGRPADPPLPRRAPEGRERPRRRQELADWITSKDNPYFARSYVNRLWGYLFGVGIIEPLDDLRAGNPATNPELLDYLTDRVPQEQYGPPARHPA